MKNYTISGLTPCNYARISGATDLQEASAWEAFVKRQKMGAGWLVSSLGWVWGCVGYQGWELDMHVGGEPVRWLQFLQELSCWRAAKASIHDLQFHFAPHQHQACQV